MAEEEEEEEVGKPRPMPSVPGIGQGQRRSATKFAREGIKGKPRVVYPYGRMWVKPATKRMRLLGYRPEGVRGRKLAPMAQPIAATMANYKWQKDILNTSPKELLLGERRRYRKTI